MDKMIEKKTYLDICKIAKGLPNPNYLFWRFALLSIQYDISRGGGIQEINKDTEKTWAVSSVLQYLKREICLENSNAKCVIYIIWAEVAC